MVIIECENQFWDGNGWSDDPRKAKQFEEANSAVLLADQLVEDLSITLPGNFISIYQDFRDPKKEIMVSCISREE